MQNIYTIAAYVHEKFRCGSIIVSIPVSFVQQDDRLVCTVSFKSCFKIQCVFTHVLKIITIVFIYGSYQIYIKRCLSSITDCVINTLESNPTYKAQHSLIKEQISLLSYLQIIDFLCKGNIGQQVLLVKGDNIKLKSFQLIEY